MNLGYIELNCILERAFGRFGMICLKLHLKYLLRECRGYVVGLASVKLSVGLTIEFCEVVEGCCVPGLEVLIYPLYPNDFL
jgi:hypothetical protein